MAETPTRASRSAAQLDAAITGLLDEVATLPRELIAWKPAPDVWSVLEILGHVAEFLPYWTGQVHRIVTRPEDAWGRDHTDAARLDAVRHAGSRSLADLVEAIRTAARLSAAALGGLHDADLAREATSRNPRFGRKPASFVIDHLLIEHVEKHRHQIRRNAAQYQDQERTSR
jgi:hypothetical protein